MPNPVITALTPFLKPDANIEDVEKLIPGTNPLEDLKDAEKDRAKGLALFESNPVLKSIRDAFVGEAVNSYKTKNYQNDLNAAVEAKLKERNPEETPAQKELREAKERIAALENKDAEKDKVIARQGLVKDLASKLTAAGFDSAPFALVLEESVKDDPVRAEAVAKALIDGITGIVEKTKAEILKTAKTTFLAGGEEPLSADDIQHRIDEARKVGNYSEALRLTDLLAAKTKG